MKGKYSVNETIALLKRGKNKRKWGKKGDKSEGTIKTKEKLKEE